MTPTLAELLHNPIWSALQSRQVGVSRGNSLARRFLPDIGPLAGLSAFTPAAFDALADLVERPGEAFILFLDTQAPIPGRLQVEQDGGLVQMVLHEPPAAGPLRHERDIAALTDADIPQMLALTALTKPGPFRERTIDLGGYRGIKDDTGRLLAMAGKRLHLPGYVEISAVCTQPDAVGRGYAKSLMSHLAREIFEQGDTPFLHTWSTNTHAIQVYEKLGYILRHTLRAVVLRAEQLQGA